jgi:glutamate-1-semialdehyde aminotransferase
MALGSVALGYADAEVTRRVSEAIAQGNVAAWSPMLEVELAERLCEIIPCAERVLFLKSGAEAVTAAVRIARTATGRTRVLGCGYFGWLDWASGSAGVPPGVRSDFTAVPFDDVPALERAVIGAGAELAALVIEPVIERFPSPDWLAAARRLCDRVGAALIFDEIKTGFRITSGGYQRLCGVVPDIATFGKAMANGFPLAVVAGRSGIMESAALTWISSTLASETSALAAATAVLDRHARQDVCAELGRIGHAMRATVTEALRASGFRAASVDGIDQMWLVRFGDEHAQARFLRFSLDHDVIFKRGAYCFASLAHDDEALRAIGTAARRAFDRLAEEDS